MKQILFFFIVTSFFHQSEAMTVLARNEERKKISLMTPQERINLSKENLEKFSAMTDDEIEALREMKFDNNKKIRPKYMMSSQERNDFKKEQFRKYLESNFYKKCSLEENLTDTDFGYRTEFRKFYYGAQGGNSGTVCKGHFRLAKAVYDQFLKENYPGIIIKQHVNAQAAQKAKGHENTN